MADQKRADAGGPFREFDFEEWLRDGVEGIRGELERTKKSFDISDFRTHIRNAQKEQLLALRSLIDSAIESVEKREEKEHSKGEKKAA